MKKSLLIISFAVLVSMGFGWFFLAKDPSQVRPRDVPERNVSTLGTSVKTNTSNLINSTKQDAKLIEVEEDVQAPEGNERLEMTRMKSESNVLKEELEGLIEEFDQHNMDIERRPKMKQRIDLKLIEYNQAVLPVAIEAMKNKQSSAK